MVNEGVGGVTDITYNYEFIEDFDDPKLGTVGKFMVEKILPFKSKYTEGDIPLVMMNKHVQNDLFVSEQLNTSAESCSSIGQHVYDKSNHTLTFMVIIVIKLKFQLHL